MDKNDFWETLPVFLLFLIVWAFIVMGMWYSPGDPVSHSGMPWE